ncbi:hypothetical protein SD71_10800 [Cohnella kolymensis]|uniref:Uncharacterized protein n=1 Tax=Cohnella kolymensis TaxID=1590652 RepID=A0ABR5A4E4_9BACL|nr:hypothetical protein SD71_10800 [Cohnella kolymensis]
MEWVVLEYVAVKSKQTGSRALTGSNTEDLTNVSAIDPNKSILIVTFIANGTESTTAMQRYNIRSTTQIMIASNTTNTTANWQLIEFP